MTWQLMIIHSNAMLYTENNLAQVTTMTKSGVDIDFRLLDWLIVCQLSFIGPTVCGCMCDF